MRYLIFLVAMFSTLSVADEEFRFTVMDAFKITGGDVDIVITGTVESGTITVGDAACLHAQKIGTREITIDAIEFFKKLATNAEAGDMIGIGVSGLDKNDLTKGDSISASCESE
jgi:translation elongation factor EF-Tu-like GTPase